jgi:putative exporter of polyketide antibiotics
LPLILSGEGEFKNLKLKAKEKYTSFYTFSLSTEKKNIIPFQIALMILIISVGFIG